VALAVSGRAQRDQTGGEEATFEAVMAAAGSMGDIDPQSHTLPRKKLDLRRLGERRAGEEIHSADAVVPSNSRAAQECAAAEQGE
jgi:hypothetical protein